MTTPAQRWAADLAAWAIPAEILDRAPETPWGCPVNLLAGAAEEALAAAPGPSRRRALEALPAGGSVLDVGVGGGAASLPLAPPAGRITGVDTGARMLEAFAALAARRGVGTTVVEGSWPDVAGEAGAADVVVCHHVLYNVADLLPFVTALTAAGRHRVVVEITATHPQARLNPLWRRFWNLERPVGPKAADAAAVIAATGVEVRREAFDVPAHRATEHMESVVAFARRRLCLPPERDPEVAAAIEEEGRFFAPRSLVTLWWDC